MSDKGLEDITLQDVPLEGDVNSYWDVHEEVRRKYHSFFGENIPPEIEENIEVERDFDFENASGIFSRFIGIRVRGEQRMCTVSTIMHELGHYKFSKDTTLRGQLDNRFLDEVAAYFCQFETSDGDVRSGFNKDNDVFGIFINDAQRTEAYALTQLLYLSNLDRKAIWDSLITSRSKKELWEKLKIREPMNMPAKVVR